MEIIDNLFDFMNGATEHGTDNKSYKCGVSDTSPHLSLCDKLINDISNMKALKFLWASLNKRRFLLFVRP